MLSRVRDFLSRHRRKFMVTGIIVGGTYFALRYAQRKFIELQEQKAREFLEMTRRVQHFESTERTCNQVIIDMGSELCTAIARECSTDSLLEQLRQNPANKLELWEEMKIVSFTRLTALIYASSMLAVTLRVQLNILGGYLYLDITTEQKQITDELKQSYLSIIRYFLQEGGLKELVRVIREKVLSILKLVPLNKRFTLNDLEQLFWSLQMAINSDGHADPITKMSKYMLPARLPPEYDACGVLLKRMFNETLDLLESDDTSSVCANNVCRGFSFAMDEINGCLSETIQLHNANIDGVNLDINNAAVDGASKTQTFGNTMNLDALSTEHTRSKSNLNRFYKPNTVDIALAKIIPIVSGLTSKGFDAQSRPQNLATLLITSSVIAAKSKMLGANIYESFATA